VVVLKALPSKTIHVKELVIVREKLGQCGELAITIKITRVVKTPLGI